MNEERLRILNMLAEGKIGPKDAAALLDALGSSPPPPEQAPAGAPVAPRYLRVVVEGDERVNVRVPFNLIRAGVRLAALLPPAVNDQINKALRENGLDLDVSKIRPENLEDVVEHLGELTVDVEGNRGEKVRVFCE